MSMNGFGNVGVSFQEILSWSQLIDRHLEPREASVLFMLSGTYAYTFEASRSPDEAPPYNYDREEQRKNVSLSLKTILDTMIARQKK